MRPLIVIAGLGLITRPGRGSAVNVRVEVTSVTANYSAVGDDPLPRIRAPTRSNVCPAKASSINSFKLLEIHGTFYAANQEISCYQSVKGELNDLTESTIAKV